METWVRTSHGLWPKLVDKWAATRTSFNRQGTNAELRGLSREASNDLIEDSVLLLKQKEQARRRIQLYFSDDLTDLDIERVLSSVNFSDKVWADNFLKKLGLRVEQKQFRDELIGGITSKKRVGLAEKLQRTESINDIENTVKKLIDNSPNAPFKYADLQKMLGDDFIYKLDKLGSNGYKILADLVAKVESG